MTAEWLPILIAGISLAVAVGGLMLQHFVVLVSLRERVTALEVKMDIFWRTVERAVPQQLISPHSPRRDVLLQKYISREISRPEVEELVTDLECGLESFPQEKRLAAVLTIVSLKTWLYDRRDKDHACR